MFYRKVLLTCLLGICSTVVFAQPERKVNSTVSEVLNKFNIDFVYGIKNGTLETMMDYFVDSVRLMPEFQRTVIHKENVASYYTAYFDRFEILEYKRDIIKIDDLGKRVVEIGSFASTIRIKGSGEQQEFEGNYMNIWNKNENNQLYLLTQAWNYNEHYDRFNEYLKFEGIPAITAAFQTHEPVNNSVSFELEALGLLLGVTISQHDLVRWAQFFADDAILIPNYYPLFEGIEAIDGYINTHIAELPTFEFLDIRSDRIDDLGDYIIEYASHVANWRTGEYSGVSTGKNIRIWRRESNCSLKIFRQIAMYD